MARGATWYGAGARAPELHSRRPAFAFREPFAIGALSFELMVRAAEEPDVADAGSASARDRHDVIELEIAARLAAVACAALERALADVTLPDGTLHVGRDVARAFKSDARRLRPRSRGERTLLELLDEHSQRQLEHLGDVSRRYSLTEQVLRAPKQLARFLVHRRLKGEALWSEWLHSYWQRGRGW